MKKILNILLGLLFVEFSAQTTTPPTGVSTTENYVYSRTYLEAVTASSTTARQVQGIQYFDGLGRPKQSIAIKASPLGRDVVTHIEYDNFGRQVKDYLPVPQTGTQSGTIYSTPLSNASASYGVEKIYSEKVLENSPLDRVFQQVQPGNDWATKPINFDYLTNVGDGINKYTITTTWAVANTDIYTTTSSLPTITTYADNTLYKNKVTDEDGNVSYEFKNGQGQTLLVRKELDASTKADTYYVYNEYDQLALVIPPLAATKSTLIQSDLDELCYQYRYDNKNRLVEKKLPSKGWEYMVYDQQDRLVLTQDANLGQGVAGNTNLPGKQWLFTKYDQFGRVIYTGIYTSTQTYGSTGRSAEQANVNSKGANNETTSTTTFTASGISVYYTNSTAYPSSITKLLSVNYYDNYPTGSPTRPTSIFSINTLPNASYSNISLKGLSTASYINNIENDAWTKTYTWYDGKARAIGSHSINYLGGYTKTETELDFAGVPQKTYTYHKRLSTDTEIVIKERFEYDNQNRLVKHWHNVNNAANDELLTFNEYNELGQLKNKKVGGTTGSQLQSVDYRYNIRGWMTGINLDATGNVQTNKLFSYKISYQEPLQITTTKPYLVNQSLEVKPKYNGNISEVTWFSGTDSTEPIKKYGYVYDGLNRLTAGFYYKKSGSNYLFTEENNEIPEYDLNGNISKLKRFAYLVGTTPNKIDDLAYTYTGNRLTNLSDAGNSSGYENASTLPIQYDSNGNMTVMPGKKIQNVSYNFLNLPDSFNLGSRNTSNNLYRADGIKIRKHNTQLNIGINGSVIDNTIIDYLDGFQYKLTYTEESSSGGGTGEIPVLGDGDGISLAMEQEAYTLGMPPIDIDPLDPIDLIPIDPIDPTPPTPLTNSELQFFPTAEGFYDFKNNLYIYQYKDHLGNVRISYSKSQSGIGVDVQDQNDYYPFGMNHLKTGVAYFRTGSWNNYKYNGKELQETGMYDYGARFYMPDIGRWGVVDPLAEVTPSFSPYAYALNNPIKFIDPTGMIAENPDPDSFWHRLTWSKSRRNAQREANSMSNIGYESQVYKNMDLWSVRGERTRDNGNTTTTSYYAASFDNNGEVYSKNWSFTTQSPEPVPMDYVSSSDATISSPSPFQGKSHFDIVMVDTNPIMPAIAGAVAPPLGFLAGSAQTVNDFSEGNYVGGTIGLLTLVASAKMSGPANQWFRGANNKFSLTPGETKLLDGTQTMGFKWGAQGNHVLKIPNPGMQKINQIIRGVRLPISDRLGLRDRGHFHTGYR